MRTSIRTSDPYAPFAFPDGRVFKIQDCAAVELSRETLTYRVNLEIMEHNTQHLHLVEVTIYWGQLTNDHRRPTGEMLLRLVREKLQSELDAWRYPERKSSYETAHKFEIGRTPPPPI